MDINRKSDRNSIYLICTIFVFFLQFLFWNEVEKVKPTIGIVPELPSKYSTELLSFGDKQFYFRVLGMEIQNAGDTFGRFTPMREYDYEKLYNWFKILDSLDSKSDFTPTLASYFATDQKPEANIYVVNYLREHSAKNPKEKWWWKYQAVYIANFKLKNRELALELADELRDSAPDDVPVWMKYMRSILLLSFDEKCQSFMIINQILKDDQNGKKKLNSREADYISDFINRRFSDFKSTNFNPKDCRDKQSSEKSDKNGEKQKYEQKSIQNP